MPLSRRTSQRAGRNLASRRATDISRRVHESPLESSRESSLRVRGAAHNQSQSARVSCTMQSAWLGSHRSYWAYRAHRSLWAHRSHWAGGLVSRNRRRMILGLALSALCLGLGVGLAAQNQAKAPAAATPAPTAPPANRPRFDYG